MTHTPHADTAAPTGVLVERRDGVAVLTLDRPDQFNALSLGMLRTLRTIIAGLADEPSIRVVVIGARGPAFCPGHDLKEMLAEQSREGMATLFQTCCEVMLGLTRLPQAVIARVHGVATAAGCQLVAACDLAIASTQARFATSGINYGLFCATPAVPISRVIGSKRALELLLTGEFIDAPTALDWGLVNRVVPHEQLDDAVAELCAVLLAKPPAALAQGKRFYHRQLGLDTEAAYAQAAALLTQQALADEGREGLSAFAAKRKPSWPK